MQSKIHGPDSKDSKVEQEEEEEEDNLKVSKQPKQF